MRGYLDDYTGDGLIQCPDCSAIVPYFDSAIYAPGTPEHLLPCVRPVYDATMHAPSCTYCHDADMTRYLNGLLALYEPEESE
jgi:hypothetical protein